MAFQPVSFVNDHVQEEKVQDLHCNLGFSPIRSTNPRNHLDVTCSLIFTLRFMGVCVWTTASPSLRWNGGCIDEAGMSGIHVGCLYRGKFICNAANLYPLFVDTGHYVSNSAWMEWETVSLSVYLVCLYFYKSAMHCTPFDGFHSGYIIVFGDRLGWHVVLTMLSPSCALR